MKYLYFFLFFISASFFTLKAQVWTEQTSGLTTQLTSISAVDDNNVWVCGYAGRVLRTTNSGLNWVSVNAAPIPGTLNLHSIFAIDSVTAIAAGSGTASFLFRTSNAGATWTQVFTEAGGFIDAVSMGNAFAGFMVGDPVGGRWSLWGTTNGGVTWDSSSFYLPQSGTEAGWNNSFFFDINVGVLFGTNNTRVYKSLSLVSWTTQVTTGQLNSYAIWFNSLFTGMTGGTALLMTSNGGLTWQNPPAALPGTANISGITGSLTSYWVVRQAAQIYFSSNGGMAWTTQYTAPAGSYRHIAKPRSQSFNTLWAVRNDGGISRGVIIPLGITPVSNEIPSEFKLEQNYPNPFNPTTHFEFRIADFGFVRLIVYDALGREIETLVNEQLQPGTYEVNFNAGNLTSGAYFYRLVSNDFSDTKKMILIK